MQISQINNLENPDLEPYRDVRKSNLTRWSRSFIAEGAWVVERLIQSEFAVDSLLVSDRKLARVQQFVNDKIKVLVAPESLLNQLVGFNFHNGVMACGIRKPLRSFDTFAASTDERQLIVACPQTTLPDNLGSIIRIAAAMGANAVAVDDRCADPFSRRVIRVSMGNTFKIPIVEPSDLFDSVLKLNENSGFEIVGTVLDQDATQLKKFHRSNKTVLLLGNEAFGLDDQWRQICDHFVTIPMRRNVDSLNVADALAIFLYELL